MITMLMDLIDKIDYMQKQMGSVSREMEILRTGMSEMKNSVTEMNNAFDGLISTLDKAEERISEVENISIESSRTKEKTNTKK